MTTLSTFNIKMCVLKEKIYALFKDDMTRTLSWKGSQLEILQQMNKHLKETEHRK